MSVAHLHPNAWLVDCYNNEQSSQEQDTLQHLYGSSDGGKTWVRLADPTHHGGPVLLADNGESHAVLATESGGSGDDFLVSLDGGRRWWRPLHFAEAAFGWSDLRFISASVGFVVGPTRSDPSHVYRTDDGGHTWRALSVR
jgi:photosystem II stability/assembly factor-like uncharacterized protein